MCLLPIVVWGMISWGRSQKKGMIICYQCDCTLDVQPLQPPKPKCLRQISEAALISPSISVLLSGLLLVCIHLSVEEMPFLCSLFGFPPERYSCRTEIIYLGPITTEAVALCLHNQKVQVEELL